MVTQGSTTTEFTYSDYQDWNNPLNKIEVFYAGKMVERKNGAVVRDLTTEETETGNVYVVVPVPPSVQTAMNRHGAASEGRVCEAGAAGKQEAPTPRLGAHPDLTGIWAASTRLDWELHGNGGRRCGPTQDKALQPGRQPDRRLRALLALAVRPVESSTLQARALGQGSAARHVDEQGRSGDDMPAAGRFRVRARRGASSSPRTTSRSSTGSSPMRAVDYAEFRMVPTDGRQHGEDAEYATTYYGDTVGRWDGDTLVLDSIGFVDTTWIGRGGYFHSDQMHIVERFKREGDAIFYD